MQVFEAFIFKFVRKQALEGRFDHLYFGHFVLISATLFIVVVFVDGYILVELNTQNEKEIK